MEQRYPLLLIITLFIAGCTMTASGTEQTVVSSTEIADQLRESPAYSELQQQASDSSNVNITVYTLNQSEVTAYNDEADITELKNRMGATEIVGLRYANFSQTPGYIAILMLEEGDHSGYMYQFDQYGNQLHRISASELREQIGLPPRLTAEEVANETEKMVSCSQGHLSIYDIGNSGSGVEVTVANTGTIDLDDGIVVTILQNDGIPAQQTIDSLEVGAITAVSFGSVDGRSSVDQVRVESTSCPAVTATETLQ